MPYKDSSFSNERRRARYAKDEDYRNAALQRSKRVNRRNSIFKKIKGEYYLRAELVCCACGLTPAQLIKIIPGMIVPAPKAIKAGRPKKLTPAQRISGGLITLDRALLISIALYSSRKQFKEYDGKGKLSKKVIDNAKAFLTKYWNSPEKFYSLANLSFRKRPRRSGYPDKLDSDFPWGSLAPDDILFLNKTRLYVQFYSLQLELDLKAEGVRLEKYNGGRFSTTKIRRSLIYFSKLLFALLDHEHAIVKKPIKCFSEIEEKAKLVILWATRDTDS